jgi:hypothetical protein
VEEDDELEKESLALLGRGGVEASEAEMGDRDMIYYLF